MKNFSAVDIIVIIVIIILIFFRQAKYANILIGLYLIYTVTKNLQTIKANRGIKAYNAGDTEKAIEILDKVANSTRSKPYIKSSYGYILLREGQIDKSEKYLKEVYEIKNLDERTKFNNILNYSILKWKQGNPEEGIRLLESIKDKFTNSTFYEIYGYLSISTGDYAKSLEINKEAYNYNNTDDIITDNLAQSYYFLGQYDKAAELYKDIIDDVKFPEAFHYYGMIKWKQGKYKEAYNLLLQSASLKSSFLSNITKEELDNTFKKFEKYLEENNIDLESDTNIESESKNNIQTEKNEKVETSKLVENKSDDLTNEDNQ
ncbi:MAG: tetratricopeptide repeat protein [Clostridium sp.]|nr:tetratricopeptide repeat protein [Clostridium sp.]